MAYTITYNLTGGSGTFPAQTKQQNVAIKLHSTKPTLNGYEFLGWYGLVATQLGIINVPMPTLFKAGDTYTANHSITLTSLWGPAGVGTTSEVPSSISGKDGFGGWFTPSTSLKGVKSRVARFAQNESGPCLGLCIMMGDHYLRFSSINPTTFHTNNRKNYFTTPTGDSAEWRWVANPQEFNLADVKTQLNAGKPVIITGKNNGGTNHAALIVGYRNNGTTNSDFIVIDPLFNTAFPTTFADFKVNFPNNASSYIYKDVERKIYFPNPMITFK